MVAKTAIPTGGAARMADIAIRFWDFLALSREQQKLLPHFGEAGTAVFAVEEIDYGGHDLPLSFDRYHQFPLYHLSWDADVNWITAHPDFRTTSGLREMASSIANSVPPVEAGLAVCREYRSSPGTLRAFGTFYLVAMSRVQGGHTFMKRLLLVGLAACAFALTPTLSVSAMSVATPDALGVPDNAVIRVGHGHGGGHGWGHHGGHGHHYGWGRGHHYGWGRGRGHHYGWRHHHHHW